MAFIVCSRLVDMILIHCNYVPVAGKCSCEDGWHGDLCSEGNLASCRSNECVEICFLYFFWEKDLQLHVDDRRGSKYLSSVGSQLHIFSPVHAVHVHAGVLSQYIQCVCGVHGCPV